VKERLRRFPWLLAALLLVSHAWFVSHYPGFINPNALAHAYGTLGMVDDGTLHIDGPTERYGAMQDTAERDGHRYSDKAPGQSVLLLPAAWLLRLLGVPLDDLRAMLTGLRLLGHSLPLVVFWLALLPVLSRWAGGRERGAALVAGGALGTVFFVYATQLFSHALAGALLFLAFLLFRRARDDDHLPAAGASGLVAGVAFTCDYIVLVAVVVLFGLTLLGGRRRLPLAAAFGAGCAVPLLAWMAYNTACFGHPLSVAYHFHTVARWQEAYNRGVAGIQPPSATSAYGMLLSPARGLFFLSPALLLAFVGWVRGLRDPGQRPDAVATLALLGGLLAFGATVVDWLGGWSVGPRYLAGTVPFLLAGVAFALRADGPRRPLAWAYALLSAVGVLTVAISAASFPAFPKDFANPVFSFALELLADGYGTPSLLLPGASGGLSAALYAGVAVTAVSYVAVRAVGGPRRRRAISALAALAFGMAALRGLAAIPEPEGTERARRLVQAVVLQQMGHPAAAAARLEELRGGR